MTQQKIMAVLQHLRRIPSSGHVYRGVSKLSHGWTATESFCKKRPFSARNLVGNHRTIVTISEEPPLHSTIPERPCTVALAQDRPLYGSASASLWEEQLRTSIPTEFGMSFASLDLPMGNDSVGPDGMPWTGLEELQSDLINLMTPQVVLIARGPLVSWWAQLYLESLPLAGLIMVDPLLPVDYEQASAERDAEYMEQVLGHIKDQVKNNKNEDKDYYLQRISSIYGSQENQRPLLLEPGAVPMLMFSTDPLWDKAASQTADRHHFYDEDDEEHKDYLKMLTWPENRQNEETGAGSIQACFHDQIAPWMERQVF